jgi:hypothetical protein
VHDLIYKRGFAKVNGQRFAIHDNSIIEKNLGSIGITGIEELIHEIVTVGPNFKKANSFLWYKSITLSIGHSSSDPPEVVSDIRDTPSRTRVTGVTVKTSSTTSSRECFERTTLEYKQYHNNNRTSFVQTKLVQ